jgi:hypothetical protein
VAAHGLSFDPFSNDVIMKSGTTINQFDPTSGTMVAGLAFFRVTSSIKQPRMANAICSWQITMGIWRL